VPKVALTDLAIRKFPTPTSGTLTYWDTTLKGFGVRIGAGGAKSFIVLIGGGRRQRLGRFPVVSLADARKEAKTILAEKTLGKVRPIHMAFDEARDEFLAICKVKNKPRTVRDYTRLLKRHYPFGRTSVGDITPREILRRLRMVDDRPAERHHAFTVGRIFFRWCMRQHYVDRSPMERIQVPAAASSRDRVLTPAELAHVYHNAIEGSSTYHRIVALLILTGQRRSEIAGLEWDWIGETTISLPAAITKNSRPHTFPLGKIAKAILEGIPHLKDNPYVFPASRDRFKGKPATVFAGWGKGKIDFDQELAKKGAVVEPYTLHDLRRTFSSGMARLGVQQIVVEKLLNHVSGGIQSPIAQVYNRYSYLDEMRAAIRTWEDYLSSLASDQDNEASPSS
jgi:integrase